MGMIIYNGKSSKDFGIFVEHQPKYEIPQRVYSANSVNGRNGDIIIDYKSFKNVNRKYDIATIAVDEPFSSAAHRIASWLHSGHGYCRLEDSYEPEYFRMACYDENNDIDNILHKAGKASITFNCKPQRFLKTGEIPIIKSISSTDSYIKITNPTEYETYPLIKITFPSQEASAWYINTVIKIYMSHGQEASFAENPTIKIDCSQTNLYLYPNARTVYIDLETGDAYGPGDNELTSITNLNILTSFSDLINYPKFYTNDNYVKVELTGTADYEQIEVIPRWWTI